MTRFRGLGRTEVNLPGELEPLDSYLSEVLDGVVPLDAEEVDLDQALGRVLAEDVTAAAPLPSFANSAMDGYAVRAADVTDASADRPAALEVVGEAAAGSADLPKIQKGTAVRIMTGAPVPPGADSVVPVEMTTEDASSVLIHRAPSDGDHIRLAGEDVAAGDRVLTAGRLLDPAAIGMAAAVGRATVRCHRRAVVAVLSTGDELVPPGTQLGPGQIHDSNGPMLVALSRTEGAVAEHRAAVRDDPDSLTTELAKAAATADLVLVSGGVSAGAHDHLADALSRLGACRSAQLAMKPGKPQVHGRIDGVPVLAVPGNPVSAFVSFELFALPILRTLHGREDRQRPVLTAFAGEDLRGSPGKRTFLRVRIRTEDDRLVADTTGGQGSHVLSALTRAGGLAEIPEDASLVRSGEPVRVRLLTDLS